MAKPLRVGFLGPFGTFTEQAAWTIVPSDSELVPLVSAEECLAAVLSGEVDRGVIPIENSIEGGVNATIDALSHDEGQVIVAETVVPVAFTLSSRGNRDIRTIGTHPHAWAQCRKWLAEHYPDAIHVPTTSTAAAAQLLSETEDAPFDAALGTMASAKQYGLDILDTDIADNPGAVTRFIMVSNPGHLPAPTGADKTTIQVKLPHDEAGALLSMLEQFSARGVNLSRIESRPDGAGLGSYAFSIDIAGHISEERVQAALVGLHRTCPAVKFLGSYPRVDGIVAEVELGTTDADFDLAREWVADILRSGNAERS